MNDMQQEEKTKKLPLTFDKLVPIFSWFILPAMFILSPAYWFFSYGKILGPGHNETIQVTISPGQGFRGVYKTLIKHGVIHEDIRFSLLASWSGVSKQLQAGEYNFELPTTPDDVLHKLVTGDTNLHPLTFPEGSTMEQIFSQLANKNLGSKQQYLKINQDQSFLTSLGITANNLEGYLFPDTYFFSREQKPRDIIKMMVDQFNTVYQEELKNNSDDAPKLELDLTKAEIINLAAIVERECLLDSERPKVARVFINRLQKKMRLQADPTVIYGLTNFDGNITKRDLRTPTPYNTYIIKGLPAGPIANPGRASIAAVLRPAPGSDLYFVAKGDGSHFFSSRLKEHNKAVRKYQKKR